MPPFKQEIDTFMQSNTLRFMCNLLKNWDFPVHDDLFFLSLTMYLPEERMAKLIIREVGRRRHVVDSPREGECEEGMAEPTKTLRKLWNNPASRQSLRTALISEIKNRLEWLKSTAGKPTLLQKRLADIKREAYLDEVEHDLLLLAFLVYVDSIRENEPLRLNRQEERIRPDFMARCLDLSMDETVQALGTKSRLKRYGLLSHSNAFLSTNLSLLHSAEPVSLAARFYRKYSGEALPWSFYEPAVQKHGITIKSLVQAGGSNRAVNILLHGGPGTGKTSFARTLAQELELDCLEINQSTAERGPGVGSEPERYAARDRFSALNYCLDHAEADKSLVVIDEADEMLGDSGGNGFSLQAPRAPEAQSGAKGILNNVLDSAQLPCIWIANSDPESLPLSSRRRFDYAIRFADLGKRQRMQIWRNGIRRFALQRRIPSSLIEELADRYEVSAGGITLALQNFADIRPKPSERRALLEQLLHSHCQLMGLKVNDTTTPTHNYLLDCLRIQGDLTPEQIIKAAQRFIDQDANKPVMPSFNILLYGPPGSGKTAFAKYLGTSLKRRVVSKTTSDLLDKWVGSTERNIADAFEEAAAEKAILFFDEIDSLLQSRARAQRSWEVTQVNELLQKMETHRGIFVAATNHLDALDHAALRRFTFKLGFDYLEPDGKCAFFRQIFQAELATDEADVLAHIPKLVPGDFQLVRQNLCYLGEAVTNHDRLAALRRESAFKRQMDGFGVVAEIGFGGIA